MVSTYRKELLTPAGDVYVATSRREANDLIYGRGYREAPESGDANAESGDDAKKTSTPPAPDKPASTSLYNGGQVSP